MIGSFTLRLILTNIGNIAILFVLNKYSIIKEVMPMPYAASGGIGGSPRFARQQTCRPVHAMILDTIPCCYACERAKKRLRVARGVCAK